MSVKTEVLKLLEASRERDLSWTGDGRITWRNEIGYLEGSEYSEKRRLSDSGSK